MVANTLRQPLAHLTPRYHRGGARLHVAWLQKDHQRPVAMGWSYTCQRTQQKNVGAPCVDMDG